MLVKPFGIFTIQHNNVFCNCKVELVDQNVDPTEVVKTPTADLHVVPPARLELTCLPHNSWSVLVSGDYQILVELFDTDNNKIYPSDNMVIDLGIDPVYWDNRSLSSCHYHYVIIIIIIINIITNHRHSLANGTLHSGVPLTPGSTPLTATLRGVRDAAGVVRHLDSPITASATMDIHNPVAVTPARTLLPWDPVGASQYSVAYKVKSVIWF